VIECIILLYRHDTIFHLYTENLVNMDSILEQLNDPVVDVSHLLIEYASVYAGDLEKGKRLLEWMSGKECKAAYLLVALGLFIPLEFDKEFQRNQIEPLLSVISREWTDKSFRSIASFHVLIFCKALARSSGLDISLVTGLSGQDFDTRIEAVVLSEEFNPIRILGDRLEVCMLFYFLKKKNEWKHIDTDMLEALMSFSSSLVTTFIKVMGRLVRQLKTRDEDVGGSKTQGIQQLQSRPMFFQPLLILIMRLYQGREDAGYIFWSDVDLFRFIKWAAELRSSELRCVYFDMMASLATGVKSAQRAFDLYNCQGDMYGGGGRASLSWEALCYSLRSVTESFRAAPDSELPPIGKPRRKFNWQN
jgi:hypothetical protein